MDRKPDHDPYNQLCSARPGLPHKNISPNTNSEKSFAIGIVCFKEFGNGHRTNLRRDLSVMVYCALKMIYCVA